MRFCLTLLVVCAVPSTATEGDGLRRHMLSDIQAALTARQPSVWGAFEGNFQFAIEWEFDRFAGPISFQRQIRRSPDGGISVTEVWRLAPADLTPLCDTWGHPGVVAWENLLGEVERGRVIASKSRGLLMIIRDYPAGHELKRVRPFPLSALPTGDFPDIHVEDPFDAHKSSRFASFLSDVFLDEVLDYDGTPISLSKHWNFEDRFSRFSPLVRIERRIRLDFSGTYSVFDIYTLGVETVLGNRDRQNDGLEEIEEGAFLDLEKKVVIIRDGFDRWHQALFARVLPLNRIPYSANSFGRLPVGVRVVYPSTAGLILAERRHRPSSLGDAYPWKLEALLGLQGTFFVSLSKRSSRQLEMRFGGSIERLAQLDTRIRPDFDGPFDPLRLVFGTLMQLRFKRAYGTRLFMQRMIDLDDDAQVEMARQVIHRGIRVSGLSVGAGAILNFSFRREVDEFLIDRFVRGKLADVTWERAVSSQYELQENYAKFGMRYINARHQTTKLNDEWVIEELNRERRSEGRSLSYVSRNSIRVLDFNDDRVVQVRGLIRDNDMVNGDAFIELVDLYTDERMSFDEYQRILSRFRACLGGSFDGEALASWPAQKRYRNARIGYRVMVSKDAVARLSRAMIDSKSDDGNRLGRWFRFHPILFRRLVRAQDKPEKNFTLVGRAIFKLAKRRGPLKVLLGTLSESEFKLEWRAEYGARPGIYGEVGSYTLNPPLLEAWETWESISVIDDLFVEQSIQARTR